MVVVRVMRREGRAEVVMRGVMVVVMGMVGRARLAREAGVGEVVVG